MKEKTALLHEGLRALIQREAAARLAALGGSDRKATAAPRRKGTVAEMRALVDTSVWIDHFHRADPSLQRLVVAGQVWTHAVVIGELAAGRLTKICPRQRLFGRCSLRAPVSRFIIIAAIIRISRPPGLDDAA